MDFRRRSIVHIVIDKIFKIIFIVINYCFTIFLKPYSFIKADNRRRHRRPKKNNFHFDCRNENFIITTKV